MERCVHHFTFTADGNRTTLHLEHTGYADDDVHAQTAQAWSFFLGNLKSWLEDDIDARATAMGMKTIG
ncbi:MAG: hypothetical protein ABI780_13330 [Ardenticatenales bacterium]